MNNFDLIKGITGKTSSMRVAFLFALFMVILNWSYINFVNKELTPLPENTVALIIGLAGAKAVQRYGEKTETK